MYKRIGVIRWLLVCSTALSGDCAYAANQNVSQVANSALPKSFDWRLDMGGPLCGVYSACRIASLYQIEADPSQFVSSRYVGDCGGSSAVQLSVILEVLGGNPIVIDKLSWLDMRLIGSPLIANVRSDVSDGRFNHWVVAVPLTSRYLHLYSG